MSMRVAVYTLTRDRLEYTIHCFAALHTNVGVPYDHYVVDNGSQDGTVDWLQSHASEFAGLRFEKENIGISRGSNMALQMIRRAVPYDLVIKMDNDCEVYCQNIIGQLVEIFQDAWSHAYAPEYVLSPRVEGIVNQPARGRYTMLAGRRIGLTGIVGGLFRAVPWRIYESYEYPENLPLAWGQDDHFCRWFKGR